MIRMVKQEKLTFEAYFEKYYQQALKYTVKKVSNLDAAEDLVMDSFVLCHKKFDLFDPEKAQFATWFYVVLNNKIKNYYRDHKEYDLMEDHLELSGSNGEELFEAVHIGELRQMLAKALKELPEQQRRIIILKYFKNMSSNEIALECGMTPGNVRVQLSRTLDKLKAFFEKNNMEWE